MRLNHKTLSRSELVDFTQLTFVAGASLMTLKDKKTLDSAGFDGTKIGVVKATTTAVALKKLIQDTSTNAENVLFNSAKDGLENLPEKGFPYTMQWSNLMRHQSENISYRKRSAVRHIFRIENDPAGPGTHAACH